MRDIAKAAPVIRITDETLPIICFQSIGKSSEADVAQLRPVYFRAFQRGRPIIALSDARRASHSADQRRLWAEWLAETMRMDTDRCTVATVVMLDSVLLRHALIALNWLTPAKVPQHVVGTTEEAVLEARAIAQHHRLNVPAHVWGQVRVWLESGPKDESGR